MYITIEKEDFRKILLGKVSVRKCPYCDNDGMEYADEDGRNASPYIHADWGENYVSEPCQNCSGLGCIWRIDD